MPTASRNERKKRRLRRNTTLLGRELRQLNARHLNAQFALVSILTGAAGTLVVSAEDVAKAMADFRFVRWQTERQEDGSMKVTLTDSRAVATPDVPADTPARPDRSVAAQLDASGPDRDADPANGDAEPGEHAVVVDAITEHVTGESPDA